MFRTGKLGERRLPFCGIKGRQGTGQHRGGHRKVPGTVTVIVGAIQIGVQIGSDIGNIGHRQQACPHPGPAGAGRKRILQPIITGDLRQDIHQLV